MTQDDSRARIERLEAALAALEAAVARVAGAERSRADLLDSLALMDEDRSRLAAELDAAVAKAHALEAANVSVEKQLESVGARLGALLDRTRA